MPQNRFLLSFLVCLVVAIPQFCRSTMGIDNEVTQVRTDPAIWIGQGRWGSYLVERFLFPPPIETYLLVVFECACLALGLGLLSSMLAIKKDLHHLLLCVLVVTFPAFAAFEQFLGNIPAISVGLLLAILAGRLRFDAMVERASHPLVEGRRPLALAMEVALIATSMGMYQALGLVYVQCALVAAFIAVQDSPATAPLRPTMLKLGRAGLVFVVAVVVYVISNEIANRLVPSSRDYIASLNHIGEFGSAPGSYLHDILHHCRFLLIGNPQPYGVSMGFLPYYLVLAMGAVVTAGLLQSDGGARPALRPRALRAALLLALVTGVLAASLALEIVTRGGVPMRGQIPLALAVAILGVLPLCLRMPAPLRLALVASTFAMAFTTWHAHSLFFTISSLQNDLDKRTAASIYERIATLPTGKELPKTIFVDFYGCTAPSYPSYPRLETVGGSEFSWDGGNQWRMIYTLWGLGYDTVTISSAEARRKNLPLFKAMPKWPSSGAVAFSDGCYLVKLGDVPDPLHADIH